MKIGLCSFAYGWGVGKPGFMPTVPMTLDDIVDKCRTLDVPLLQACNNTPLADMSKEERTALKDKINSYHIEMEVGSEGLYDENMDRHVAICEEFGARLLRMVYDGPGYDPTEDQILGVLRNWMPILEKKGIRLAIENHDGYSAKYMASICDRIDSAYCGICLDTANSLGNLEDTDTILKWLAPHANSLHLKDVKTTRLPSTQGFIVEGMPVGYGKLDVPYIVKAVGENGRDANWILEQWTAFEQDMDTTAAKEQREAELSIAYMKNLMASL